MTDDPPAVKLSSSSCTDAAGAMISTLVDGASARISELHPVIEASVCKHVSN